MKLSTLVSCFFISNWGNFIKTVQSCKESFFNHWTESVIVAVTGKSSNGTKIGIYLNNYRKARLRKLFVYQVRLNLGQD